MSKNAEIEKESLLLIWSPKNSKPRLFIRELNSLTASELKELLAIHNCYLNPPDDWDGIFDPEKNQEKTLKKFKSNLDIDDTCDEKPFGWFEHEWNVDLTNPICNYNINVIICCGE